MENCCAQKRTKVRSGEEKKKIVSRLNRIAGQIGGVKKMIEEDRYCDDVLVQLAAIDKSVKSLAGVILEGHLHSCLIENIREGNLTVVDEVVDLFKRFQ